MEKINSSVKINFIDKINIVQAHLYISKLMLHIWN